ncbi:MAG: D-alanyl-D-alanine carboxypeptidase [Gammaproteobacteria bacterium]|nr:D-alanyl-D-alanine carboxypeptidase [Gammaproteobacteria bacterium]
MNHLKSLFNCGLVVLLFCFSLSLLHAEKVGILTPAAPAISASSYILQDYNTGKVLAESKADARLAPASLTKILSVYVIFNEIKNGHLKLDELVTISQNAWKTSGSKMFVNVNDQVKVEDLLKGVIIQSGNDASVALAEHVAGNEATFAELMNQHAARLGMINSHFNNADGLPNEGHYTTARDLAILTTALIKEFPQYYPWFSLKEFTYNKITQPNRNLLLYRDDTVDGVKTGHTDEAGFCLVASALRGNMRLISVVMGTESENARANANQTLLNYGFRFFESRRLYQGNTVIQESRIWKGESQTVELGLAEDLFVTIPRRNNNDLKAIVEADNLIVAPVKADAKLGKVTVKLGEEVLSTKDLIAIKAVNKGGIFRRLLDSLLMLFRKHNG